MSENEDRLLRAQVVVDPDLGAIQIAGERVRNISDDDWQLIPLFEIFLDDVEDFAEPVLADHRHASYRSRDHAPSRYAVSPCRDWSRPSRSSDSSTFTGVMRSISQSIP